MGLCSSGISGADDANFPSPSSGTRDLAAAFPLGIASVSHARHGPPLLSLSPPPLGPPNVSGCTRGCPAGKAHAVWFHLLPTPLTSGTPPPAHPRLSHIPRAGLCFCPHLPVVVLFHATPCVPLGTAPRPSLSPWPHLSPPAPSPGCSRCAHSPLLLPQARQPAPCGGPCLPLSLPGAPPPRPHLPPVPALLLRGAVSELGIPQSASALRW